jgi:hypothetical protein
MEALQDQVPIAGAFVITCSANSQRRSPQGDANMKFATTPECGKKNPTRDNTADDDNRIFSQRDAAKRS